MDTPVIAYKQAGMLRRMPGQGESGQPVNASVRAGWGALVRAGLAECRSGLHRRTPAGERWLSDYDANLDPQDMALLDLIRKDAQAMRGTWAVHRLVGAGLVFLSVRSNGIPSITPAGLAILQGNRMAA